MRQVSSRRAISIPDGVTVTCKARKVRVKGPKGVLTKDFTHTKIDLAMKGKEMVAQVFWGNRAQKACLRTVTSHVENMIKGVTQGYKYKMRLVYAHFPINVKILEGGTVVELKNYLGQKIIRRVELNKGVTIVSSSDVKDELVLTGICVDAVSQSAANIQQSTRCCDKDIRKFLDGAYVSGKEVIDPIQ